MEILDTGIQIVLLDRTDLLTEYQNLPLEDIDWQHFKEKTTLGRLNNSTVENPYIAAAQPSIKDWVEQAHLVIFQDALSVNRIMKNEWGYSGIITRVPKKRQITITLTAVDSDASDDHDMLDPSSFDHILVEYLNEISSRLDNVYAITLEKINIK